MNTPDDRESIHMHLCKVCANWWEHLSRRCMADMELTCAECEQAAEKRELDELEREPY